MMIRQKSKYGMLIWAFTMLLLSTLLLGGCGVVPTVVMTPTPTPETPTVPLLGPDTGWHVLFQQHGYAKAGVTTHKVFGDITVSRTFTLEVACVGSGSVQAQIVSGAPVSGSCNNNSSLASDTEVSPASSTHYPVTVELQGPVQWEIMVEEKDLT